MIELDVAGYLNRLEETIRSGKKAFMSDLKSVDDRACLEYISRIREMLPSELSEARVVAKEKNNILNNANLKAQEIIKQAQDQARMMVQDHPIMIQAQDQANKIVASATDYANEIVEQAYNEVLGIINDAQASANEVMSIIQRSKSQLYETIDSNNAPNPNNPGNGMM